MPSLGADMDAGTLVEWFRKPGDVLKRGDIIALVETQKGAIEIEVFDDGVLGPIAVQPGHKVPVGAVLAKILEPGERLAPEERTPPPSPAVGAPGPVVTTPPGPSAEARQGRASAKPTEPKPAVSAAAPGAVLGRSSATAAGQPGEPKVTPAARARAAAAGLDITGVAPGASGIVGLAEVAAAIPSEVPVSVPARKGLDLGEMRKAIAAAMSRSHREIPHFWVSRTIDVTDLFAWLEAENARRPVASRLLYAAPLAKAVALALKDVPELNGHFVDGAFRSAEHVHLGIATALRGGGLVAPALHDVETTPLDPLMATLSDLIPRARAGRLRSSEMTDGTATLSNLGEGTSDALMPLIYPPQVAIVGCGAVVWRPWIVGGSVVARRVMTVTLAADHRVSDGRRGSQFLSRMDDHLQKPEAL